MNPSTWLKLGLPLVVIFLTGIIIYVQTGDDPKGVKDETRCPDCGRELPDQAQATGECPYCKLAASLPEDGKKKKKKGGGIAISPIALVFIIFPILATLALLIIHFRRNRVLYVDQEYAYFRCPHCKRKLRFPVTRANHRGMCPLCRRPLIFPKATAKPIEL
jgi:Zn finger protein HypA/HybF involved in hydrogenase expression